MTTQHCCEECRTWFDGRAHARYCGRACRQRAYRKRVNDRADPDDRAIGAVNALGGVVSYRLVREANPVVRQLLRDTAKLILRWCDAADKGAADVRDAKIPMALRPFGGERRPARSNGAALRLQDDSWRRGLSS